MDETSQVLPNLSRRTFIKGAAAMVAAGAVCNELLPGHLGVAEAAENGTATDQIYSGACRGACRGNCYLNVHVRDGRVVRTTAGSFPSPSTTASARAASRRWGASTAPSACSTP